MRKQPNGLPTTAEHRAWNEMHARCRNREYSGRGIRVEFASFGEFLAHVGPRPSPRHRIDIIDNRANYAPGNVRWVIWPVQAPDPRRRRER
jgi:hypothetical protein